MDKKSINNVRYGLRFHILPDENALSRAKELVRFCRKHKILEVHLFFNAEEWNRGHATESEIKEITANFRKIIPLLKRAGLSINLNPWITVLHCDRGRTLRKGQGFELMVSPTGKMAKAVASPACPEWRKYITDLYRRMAELGFDTIWLEDDFRYHNHSPLDWGGDFSERMMSLFSHKIGKKVSRPELVKNILQSGKPHPWRKTWLELWRRISETNAGRLRDAVKSVNPKARLGLMSSHPDVHSAEGRKWKSLFKALAINGRAVHRPNFAGYGETTGSSLINSFALLDIQKRLRPEWVESYSEVENFPFGRFNKSDTLTFVQMALAKIMGSEGLLLDLHPMTGNSVFEEEGIGELLDKSFPGLAYLGQEFNRKMESQGVGVLFKEDAAESIRTDSGDDYQNLIVWSTPPANLLGMFGVAFQMGESESANLIWGKKAWSFSDKEVKEILTKGLWLDAESADILIKRGFGKYLGIESGGWLYREKSLYSVERSVYSGASGVRAGFNSGCNQFTRILKFNCRRGKAYPWTEVVDCFNKPVGTGLSIFKNELGGTVAVSAFPLNEEGSFWNPNFQRQRIVQNLINILAEKNPPVMVSGTPHLFPIDLQFKTRRKIVVFNLSTDSGRVQVHLPGVNRVSVCTVLDPLSRPRRVSFGIEKSKAGLTVIPKTVLPFYGLIIIDFPSGATAIPR
ncbi:MAG: hypothetical protein V2A65_04115 [Candidatus Omnitrophota bacterium]